MATSPPPMSAAFAGAVAAAVFRAYDAQPTRGKPQRHEWAMLAGVVACVPCSAPGASEHELLPVAVCTGAKCVGQGAARASGAVLNDSHAEVLARRGLKLALLREIEAHLRVCGSAGACRLARPLLQCGAPATRGFSLRQGVSLHLYVSDAPCGDATVYEDACAPAAPCGSSDDGDAAPASGRAAAVGFRRTGAKLVQGPSPGAPASVVSFSDHAARQHAQLGALRTKAGRSDLPAAKRTVSMCCSDKLARWAGVGVQGALLAQLLTAPLFLDSIITSAEGAAPGESLEPRLRALHRAVVGRAAAAHAAAHCALPRAVDGDASVASGSSSAACSPSSGGSDAAAVAADAVWLSEPDCAFIPAAAAAPALAVVRATFREGRHGRLLSAAAAEAAAAAAAAAVSGNGASAANLAAGCKRLRPWEKPDEGGEAGARAAPPMTGEAGGAAAAKPAIVAGGTGSGAPVVPCAWSTNAVSHVWDAPAAPTTDAAPGSEAAAARYSSGVDLATKLPVFMWRPAPSSSGSRGGGPLAPPPVAVSVECTLAAAGLLGGATKSAAPELAASRLCKRQLGRACVAAFAAARTRLVGTAGSAAADSSCPSAAGQQLTYHTLKTQGAWYRAALEAFHAPGCGFDGWLRGQPELEAFVPDC